MELEKRKTLDSVDPFELEALITVKIADLNVNLARTQNPVLIQHTASMAGEYLHQNYSHYSIPELHNIFKKIAQGDLGKIYDVSFNSLCVYIKEYDNVRQVYNKKKDSKGNRSEFVDKANSDENVKACEESVKNGILDPKLFYTSEQMMKLDPEYRAMKGNHNRQLEYLKKSKR